MTLTLVPEAIEDYAAAHSEPLAPLFDELREETYAKMTAPNMQVGRLEGSFLKILIRLARARRVLELGMFTGYSALMMAEALPEDGELITCDINPKAEEVARRYFARSPHGRKIQIRMGPALETIKTLQGLLDLVFIDADKENYSRYYDAVLPLLRSGGLIVADNTLWSGRILAPEHDSDRALVAFNDKVAQDSRVEKVLLTVRDGMMLALKK
jgi:caffeoyl-CoA O-methyltransferase